MNDLIGDIIDALTAAALVGILIACLAYGR